MSRSRERRDEVARGSMSYSAVTQPEPRPRIQPGTCSSTEAAQSTAVSPISIIAEPSADSWQPVVIRTGRNWSQCLSSARISVSVMGVMALSWLFWLYSPAAILTQ